MEKIIQDLRSMDIVEPVSKDLYLTDLELDSFDVVIPTKNSERTIKKCLEALFSSDIPIKKVIIIDKSTDSTPKIAEEMCCTVIIADVNYCQALRLGASLCETPYFIILDSDILINPKFYLKLKSKIKENFICKGTFYDYISWKSLAKHLLTQRRKKIGGLDAAFVNRATFLELTRDWDKGFIDAGGDTQLFRHCKERGIYVYQDTDLINLHLVSSHRRHLKQTYWYGKSARTSGLHPWNYFLKRFFKGFILGFTFAFRYNDLRYIPFKIWEGIYYLLGYLQGR